MNIKRGLRRLNILFLGAVFLFAMLIAGENMAQMGYNLGIYLVFVVAWLAFCWLVGWLIRGFSEK